MFLTKSDIKQIIESEYLIVRPLLSESQIGEISLDLRLGTDFLVSIQGREPFLDATGKGTSIPISSFFQETKRMVGESFFLHPHQTVLCSTLEYVKLPEDVFFTLSTRSSYSRLGLNLSSIVQPGYCGCISLELTNTNNNPIKLLVGAAILQARLFRLDSETNYFNSSRKYICQVRPVPSRADQDSELDKLRSLFEHNE